MKQSITFYSKLDEQYGTNQSSDVDRELAVILSLSIFKMAFDSRKFEFKVFSNRHLNDHSF